MRGGGGSWTHTTDLYDQFGTCVGLGAFEEFGEFETEPIPVLEEAVQSELWCHVMVSIEKVW